MASLLNMVILTAVVGFSAANCPEGCTCPPDTVSCQENTVVPSLDGISASVKKVTLSGNSFTNKILTRSNFSRFTQLEELNLRGCEIEAIGYDTFVDLTNLKKLDLGWNNIRVLDGGAFKGLHLEYLFLGNNLNMVIMPTAFRDMTTELLVLENNRMEDINPEVFSPLKESLKKLFLNGNRFTRFQPAMKEVFESLDILRIHENPFTCDCDARWLKIFYDDNTGKIRDSTQGQKQEPRCERPSAIATEMFSRLTITDFSCVSPTIESKVDFTEDRAVVSCTTRGNPLPEVALIRPNGVRASSPPISNMLTNTVSIEVLANERQIHGKYRCVATNDAGNTSFVVNMTWPFNVPGRDCGPAAVVTDPSREIDITLPTTVAPDTEAEQSIFKMKYFTLIDLISAIFGTFVGTLVVCVIILHFCVYKRRQPTSQYSTPPMSEYSASSSIKNGGYPPQMLQHTMQNRPLPYKPGSKIYDENHYMSTNLEEDQFLHGPHGHHGEMSMAHPCEACRTMNSSRVS